MIELNNLKKYYAIEKGFLKRRAGFINAVDGVALCIKKGKTLGLVGESGCGKTTLGKMIVNLIKPDSGEITFDGIKLSGLRKEEERLLRKRSQFIFQDPYNSLDPRMTMEEIITEPIKIGGKLPKKDIEEKFLRLTGLVRLPASAGKKYPHQFSGGERQRIGIARALALEPEFIVCDEPVSSLDVSIQAQILNLLKELQENLNITYLFISHDLSVVEFMSDEVAVMYRGKIIETAENEELFKNPLHPYTKCLLQSIPIPDPKKSREPFPDEIEDFHVLPLKEVKPRHFAAL